MNSKNPIKLDSLKRLKPSKLLDLANSVQRSKNLGSISEISGKQLIDEVGNVDLLTYSFPCQDLSMGASFIGGGAGMKKGSGTRSGLLWEIERIVDELDIISKKPTILLMENVKNMLSKSFRDDYHQWVDKLDKIGYETRTFVLDSSNFGIPQKRERVFAVSVLKTNKTMIKKLREMNPENVKIKLPKVQSFLRENYNDENIKMEAIDSMVNRTPSRKFIYDKARKLNTDKKITVTKTLTTKQDRNPNSGVIALNDTVIGDDNRPAGKANFRFLTPREQMLLMGFSDDDFINTKKSDITKRQYWVLAGNSIVVNVVEWIFKELLC